MKRAVTIVSFSAFVLAEVFLLVFIATGIAVAQQAEIHNARTTSAAAPQEKKPVKGQACKEIGRWSFRKDGKHLWCIDGEWTDEWRKWSSPEQFPALGWGLENLHGEATRLKSRIAALEKRVETQSRLIAELQEHQMFGIVPDAVVKSAPRRSITLGLCYDDNGNSIDCSEWICRAEEMLRPDRESLRRRLSTLEAEVAALKKQLAAGGKP